MTSSGPHDTDLPTVLVADDDADILRLVSQRLKHRGYQVLTASNGDEALEVILSDLPDAAVLDGIMPGIEGHQICARMRADERAADIPVILLTAKAGDTDEREAADAGVDAYVGKPFRIEQLDAKLKELLASAQARRQ